MMADEKSFLENPSTQDMAVHVHDYTRFTKMMLLGAIACFIVGFMVPLILK